MAQPPKEHADGGHGVRYVCGPEWHFAKLKSTPMAGYIYGHAFRITNHGSRLFHGSVLGLAAHFGVSRSTVQRAIKVLVDLGFFEVVRERRFGSTMYQVLSHHEWAKKYPGQCAVKGPEESDPLKEALFTLSGGVLFPPAALYKLRRLYDSNWEVEQAFKKFLDQQPAANKVPRFLVESFLIWVDTEYREHRASSGTE